jgi:hypothetical protein
MSILRGIIVSLIAVLAVSLVSFAAEASTRCGDVQLKYRYDQITAGSVRIIMERTTNKKDNLVSARINFANTASTNVMEMVCGGLPPAVYCSEDDPENCYLGMNDPMVYNCSRDIMIADISDVNEINSIDVVFKNWDDKSEYTCNIPKEMLVPPAIVESYIRTLDGVEIELTVSDPDWASTVRIEGEYFCFPMDQTASSVLYSCELDMDAYEILNHGFPRFVRIKTEPIAASIRNEVRVSYHLTGLSIDNNPDLALCPEDSVEDSSTGICECSSGFTASADRRSCDSGIVLGFVGQIQMYPIFYDSDGDGVSDVLDQCPGHPDGDDMDGDSVPDECDDDMDGDAILNVDDDCPTEHATVDEDVDGCEDEDDYFSIVPGGGHNVGDDSDDDSADDGAADDTSGSTNSANSDVVDIWGGGACSLNPTATIHPFVYFIIALGLLPIIVRRRR